MNWDIASIVISVLGFLAVMAAVRARACFGDSRVCVRCGAVSTGRQPWRVIALCGAIIVFATTIGFIVSAINGVTQTLVASGSSSALIVQLATITLPLMLAGVMIAYLTDLADPVCLVCGAKALVPVSSPKGAEILRDYYPHRHETYDPAYRVATRTDDTGVASRIDAT